MYVFSVCFCFGQITTTKVAPKLEKIDITPYDSTQNFLRDDVRKYIGQELYLKGLNKDLRKYGYRGFSSDYTAHMQNPTKCEFIYKCDGRYSSKYEDIAEKYFNVLDVIKHPKAEESELLYGKKYFLKLQEKEKRRYRLL
jgi:hypothetical protein